MPQPLPTTIDELRRISADLDRVIADMSSGRPSQPRHDGHIDQVEALATRMRRAVRGPGRPSNLPLARVGSGYVW